MLDYTTDPAMLHLTSAAKETEFDLLRPSSATKEGYSDSYRISDLVKLTKSLMSMLSLNFDRCRDIENPHRPRRVLADFSEAEKRLYLPFAFMLACVDGNAFRTGQLNPAFVNPDVAPSPETISQYIPDAAHIMELNSATEDELRALIANASENTC